MKLSAAEIIQRRKLLRSVNPELERCGWKHWWPSLKYSPLCEANATMRPVCIVELHGTVDDKKILTVAQQCFCGKFMSPVTIKLV
jgi:hypothetical protein